MENIAQFFTNASPYLLLLSILLLVFISLSEEKEKKRLEQERKAIFLLLWRANQILAEKDKVMVFLNLENKEELVLIIAQCFEDNSYQHREHVHAHYVDGELKLIG